METGAPQSFLSIAGISPCPQPYLAAFRCMVCFTLGFRLTFVSSYFALYREPRLSSTLPLILCSALLCCSVIAESPHPYSVVPKQPNLLAMFTAHGLVSFVSFSFTVSPYDLLTPSYAKGVEHPLPAFYPNRLSGGVFLFHFVHSFFPLYIPVCLLSFGQLTTLSHHFFHPPFVELLLAVIPVSFALGTSLHFM